MHNTGNPLGSNSVLDLYDNSETIDNFVNSQQDEVPDRFGTKRLTLSGLIKRSMALRNEINDFSGALTFKPEWSDVPMNVSEGVGGEGGTLNLQAEALGNRSEINKITSREALCRSYAEAGYKLVTGSFEAGGTLVNANDVLLQERTGKVFTGQSGVVTPGTNPASPGFFDVSDSILRQQVLIKFTGSGSFSAVDNMVAGRVNNVAGVVYHLAGNEYSTGNTTWMCIADGATTISGFSPTNDINLRDFGAKGDGVADDSGPLSETNVYDNIIIPPGIYRISNNTHIKNTSRYSIRRGAVFYVDAGITLTWDAEIDAGHYQIFSGDGSVLPTNRLHNTPKENRFEGTVKAAWFGVVGDGILPATYKLNDGTPSYPDGADAIGTDDTIAFKKALAFAQTASYKDGVYLNQKSVCAVELEEGAQIILKGSRILNEQIYVAELDALYQESLVSGGNFKALPEYSVVKTFDFKLIGNKACILWHPDNPNAVFAAVKQLICELTVDDLSLTPVGIPKAEDDAGYGYFLQNAGLVQKGNPSVGSFNHLSFQRFTNCSIAHSNIGGSVTALSSDGAFKYIFGYIGYAVGDRLHLKDCRFNGFRHVVYCQNPESVEFNATGCEFRSSFPDAQFFKYLSFYGQFRVEGCGLFFKGANQTMLSCENSAGISSFVSNADFSFVNNRYEGSLGNSVTLVDADFGRIYMNKADVAYATSAANINSTSAKIRYGASVIFEQMNVPSKALLENIDATNHYPFIARDCKIEYYGGIDGFVFADTKGGTGRNYRFAMAQNARTPAVVFENPIMFPNVAGANYIKPPRIYGGGMVSRSESTKTLVFELDGANNPRLSQKTFIFPMAIVITAIRFIAQSNTSNYDAINLRFGDVSGTPVTLTAALPPFVSHNIAMLVAQKIAIPSNLESFRSMYAYFSKSGVEYTGGSTPCRLEIEYRCAMFASEAIASGVNDPVLLPE